MKALRKIPPPNINPTALVFQFSHSHISTFSHSQNNPYFYPKNAMASTVGMTYGKCNVRVVFNTSGILSENHYYPFGLPIHNLSTSTAPAGKENRYLYNGKLERIGNPASAGELQDDLGLNWMDYGARFYDAGLGRWHSVDPLAEKRECLSPYNYCSLNPINRIDPDGALDDGYQDMQNNYKWFDDEKADVIGRDNKLWVKVTDDRNVFDLLAAGIFDNLPKQNDPGTIKPYSPNIFGNAYEYINSPSITPEEATGKFALGIIYGVADDIMVYGSNLVLGPEKARHLNNSGAYRPEITNSGLNIITTFFLWVHLAKALD